MNRTIRCIVFVAMLIGVGDICDAQVLVFATKVGDYLVSESGSSIVGLGMEYEHEFAVINATGEEIVDLDVVLTGNRGEWIEQFFAPFGKPIRPFDSANLPDGQSTREDYVAVDALRTMRFTPLTFWDNPNVQMTGDAFVRGSQQLVRGDQMSLQVRVPGDMDGDFDVDFSDFLFLTENFGRKARGFASGDFNLDRSVDFLDYLILHANFGRW